MVQSWMMEYKKDDKSGSRGGAVGRRGYLARRGRGGYYASR